MNKKFSMLTIGIIITLLSVVLFFIGIFKLNLSLISFSSILFCAGILIIIIDYILLVGALQKNNKDLKSVSMSDNSSKLTLNENNNYDDYKDYDDVDEEENITYTKVTTNELYNNFDDYNDGYITTTIKVTKADDDSGLYYYTVRNIDGYDEVSIVAVFYSDETIKKGDYITISGECCVEYNYDTFEINIYVYKKNKTNVNLFEKLNSDF